METYIISRMSHITDEILPYYVLHNNYNGQMQNGLYYARGASIHSHKYLFLAGDNRQIISIFKIEFLIYPMRHVLIEPHIPLQTGHNR